MSNQTSLSVSPSILDRLFRFFGVDLRSSLNGSLTLIKAFLEHLVLLLLIQQTMHNGSERWWAFWTLGISILIGAACVKLHTYKHPPCFISSLYLLLLFFFIWWACTFIIKLTLTLFSLPHRWHISIRIVASSLSLSHSPFS